MSAMFRSLPGGSVHTIYKEIPIRIYSVVQTGPNNQFGGLKEGWFKVAYQLGIARAVKIPAMAPIASGNAREIINFVIEVMFIYVKSVGKQKPPQIVISSFIDPELLPNAYLKPATGNW